MEPIVLVDCAYGVHIPHVFFETYKENIKGKIPAWVKEALSDAFNPYYWEAMEYLETLPLEIDGQKYYLWYDNDLFAFPEGLSVEDYFGEELF